MRAGPDAAAGPREALLGLRCADRALQWGPH